MKNRTKKIIIKEMTKSFTDVEEFLKDRKAGLIDDTKFIEDGKLFGTRIANSYVHPLMYEELGVKCSNCGKIYMLSKNEMTDKEKKHWLCPECYNKRRKPKMPSKKLST